MIESKSIALPTWRYPNIEVTFLVILNLNRKYKGFLSPCPLKTYIAENLISDCDYDNSISSGDSERVSLLFQFGENVFGRNYFFFIYVQDQISGS